MYDGLCVCPVHASHPFVVLSCQPAYVCPVLSLPYFACRTEGMLKLYLLSICQNRPNTTATLYVVVTRPFLPIVWGLLPTRYVSCIVSVSFLQPYA